MFRQCAGVYWRERERERDRDRDRGRGRDRQTDRQREDFISHNNIVIITCSVRTINNTLSVAGCTEGTHPIKLAAFKKERSK